MNASRWLVTESAGMDCALDMRSLLLIVSNIGLVDRIIGISFAERNRIMLIYQGFLKVRQCFSTTLPAPPHPSGMHARDGGMSGISRSHMSKLASLQLIASNYLDHCASRQSPGKVP